MNEELFYKVAAMVAVAMDHRQANHEHNRLVVDKVTRDILRAVAEELPEPIDIEGKWELDGEEGVYVDLKDDFRHDGHQLTYLAKFASDQGYNKALRDMQMELFSPTDMARSVNL